MIITRKLIQNFININNISDEQIEMTLNNLGYEVENVKKFSNNTNVILGKIIDYNHVKDSKKLNLVKVQIDNNIEKVVEIICGANNLSLEMYVIVALPGAKLANGMEIKKTKIFGIESSGMLCSFSELGCNSEPFKNDNNGKIVEVTGKYSNDKFLGNKDILKLIGLDDTLFEFDITSNRSYALSAKEVMKELALFLRKSIKYDIPELDNNKEEHKYKIINNTGAELKGLSSILVKVDNSKNYEMEVDNLIKNLGINKNNSVEQLAQYISMKEGQPLILIDADKVKDKLYIRNDYISKENKTQKGELVITCGEEFVSLVGIKQSQKYTVTKGTKNVLVISAYFDNNIIRKIQKKYSVTNLNIQRFMRFNTAVNINDALKELVILLEKFKILKNYSNIKIVKSNIQNINNISISLTEINSLIGQELNSDKIYELLHNMHFNVKLNKNKDFFNVEIPSIRFNLITKDDLVEEILRLYNYNNISSKDFFSNLVTTEKNIIDHRLDIINNILINNNFYECKTFQLVEENENKKFNIFNYKNQVKLINPLSSNHQVMRFNLISSLLKVIIHNISHQQSDLKIFTTENIYHSFNKNNIHLAAMVSGDIINHKISGAILKNNFFYLKGIFESIINKIGLDFSYFNLKTDKIHDLFNPYQSAKIFYENKMIGYIGAINPKYFSSISKNIYSFEINLSEILKIKVNEIKYSKGYINNPISRDITFMNSKLTYKELKNKISHNINNLINIEFKDYYVDELNNNALTLSFVFNSNIKQLQNTEVNIEFEKILQNANNLEVDIKN